MTLAEDEVKDTMRAALPLVLAVNCLSDCELERRTLSGSRGSRRRAPPHEAVVQRAHRGSCARPLARPAPSLQHQAFMPSLVVVLSP